MLTVDDYGAIRRARRDGKSIRQIACEFDHSRNTVRKVLKQSGPDPLPATRNRPAPLLDPVRPIIDQILRDDEDAPPKQRHTAAQLFRRLRDEPGYRSGYGQVRRYVRQHRRRHRGPSAYHGFRGALRYPPSEAEISRFWSHSG